MTEPIRGIDGALRRDEPLEILRVVRALPARDAAVGVVLERLAGRRLTRDGVLVITAQRYRTQERNRQDALARLIALVRQAAEPPVPRTPTRPSAASRRRRLAAKARRGSLKAMRGARPDED